MKYNELVITAASESFSKSLFALIGSMNVNWPNHPKIIVYDIGLGEETLKILSENNIEVRKVPPFCNHWRKHFTWKIWCWNDAPTEKLLYLDAGIAVLGPLDEAFKAIDSMGYFIRSGRQGLSTTATPNMFSAFGLSQEFGKNKMTYSGGLIGFKKDETFNKIINMALEAAKDEDCIKSYTPDNRHDQALFSILLHKYIGNILVVEKKVYGGRGNMGAIEGQKLWVHRGHMNEEDMQYYAEYLSKPGKPYLPSKPRKKKITMREKLFVLFKKAMSPKRVVRALVRKMRYILLKIFNKKNSQDDNNKKIYNGVR